MEITKEQLISGIKDSRTLKEVCVKLNLVYNKGSRKKLIALAKFYGIDLYVEIDKVVHNPFNKIDIIDLKNLASKCSSYSILLKKLNISSNKKIRFNLKKHVPKEWLIQPNYEYVRRAGKFDINFYYQDNRELMLKNNQLIQKVLKKEVIEHYGGKCVCCGETELDFLCLDHINNDGAKHKKELKKIGKSVTLYRYAKNKGYPKDLQILCWNCNWSKRIHGKCIHQIMKDNSKNAALV